MHALIANSHHAAAVGHHVSRQLQRRSALRAHSNVQHAAAALHAQRAQQGAHMAQPSTQLCQAGEHQEGAHVVAGGGRDVAVGVVIHPGSHDAAAGHGLRERD